MTYFHPEEEFQFGVLYEYGDERPGTRYLVEQTQELAVRPLIAYSSNMTGKRPKTSRIIGFSSSRNRLQHRG